MSSLPVIVDFQILKKRLSGLLVGGANGIAHALLFERAKA
jgi:hypothetical protein